MDWGKTAPGQFKFSEPSVLRGEPMMTGGKPVIMGRTTIVAPNVPGKNAAAGPWKKWP